MSARVTGPVGVGIILLVMVMLLVVEPALAWFILSTLLLGIVVAAILHASQHLPAQETDQQRPEIQISKIPVKGAMGLVFTIGTMAIFFVALPQVRWFLALALPSGLLIGVGLHRWHNRHP